MFNQVPEPVLNLLGEMCSLHTTSASLIPRPPTPRSSIWMELIKVKLIVHLLS